MKQASAALDAASSLLSKISQALARQVAHEGRLGPLDPIEQEAFQLARHLAQHAAAKAVLAWGEKKSGFEQRLATCFTAISCAELAQWSLTLPSELCPDLPEATPFLRDQLSTASLAELGRQVAERLAEPGGERGLSEDHQALRESLFGYASEHLGPLTEEIHRRDRLIPEPVLQGLAELGVFGVSIPEEYGGCFMDHTALVVATEALSEVSLGAGGSVITRPEICAKAILAGGSPAQKQAWLPKIASGERMVCVAVTEPDAGSDVAAMRLKATRTAGGYLLNGEKTWCTFAGRADLFVLIARTGSSDEGHKGLSLFLVEKPATPAGEGDEYAFEHKDSHGTMTGKAIPTVGYRGMHSFSVNFEDWYVPEANRIGDEGQGFYLTMKGFVGGRIQTAARAVGLMEAALRLAVRYVGERKVFGKTLGELSLPRCKLAQMAARVQAGRQLAYRVGHMLDSGQGEMEASLVKLLTCRDAEWVTREAMQLHGGLGYSEECAASRYWLDARVLSIFEGAEEVLALRVIGRRHLKDQLAKLETVQ